jgi:DNA-binding beta-propeller fold protein YncE
MRCSYHLIKVVAVLNFLALSLFLPTLSYSQTCTWGGTPPADPPSVTFLRSDRGPFRSPGQIAIDPADGRRYITDPGRGRVLVRDAEGRLQTIEGGFNVPMGIAVGDSGEVYVGEAGSGTVTVFDRDLAPLDTLGVVGDFIRPNAISVDTTTGRIYVVDSGTDTVEVYSWGGMYEFRLVGFGLPVGVYVEPVEGKVFVADRDNNRIQVFTRDGVFLGGFPVTGPLTAGITGDSSERLYVSDSFQGHVKVFDQCGTQITTIGSRGKLPGQFRIPLGLAIDPFNRLFVASANNTQVDTFGLDAFSDPSVVEAVVDIDPNNFKRSTKKQFVTVYIETPDYPIEGLIGETITANGEVPSLAHSPIGDHDGDGIPDCAAKFDAQAFLATLPDGESAVSITGEFMDGSEFEGLDTVIVNTN